MQINIHLLSPQKLKIAFVYNRTDMEEPPDELDEEILCFAERLSSSISNEAFNIERFQTVDMNNFDYNSYNSSKATNLMFKPFYKNRNTVRLKRESIICLNLYFDTDDKTYINNIIKSDYEIIIPESVFERLETLITEGND